MTRSDSATLIVMPGGWHGAWAFEPVLPYLEAAGVPVRFVATPSLGGADRRGIPADVEAITAEIDKVDGPVVLAGHSYAGVPITEAGTHPRVEHLVYLAAFMADREESVGTLMLSPIALQSGEDSLAPAIGPDDSGEMLVLDPEQSRHLLYGDLDDDAAAAAIALLKPHVAGCFGQAPGAVAWLEKPSTYMLCTRDKAIPPTLQRHLAERAGATVELDSDHSPFLSQPKRLADELIDIAKSVG